jgi:hypothetical protein
MSVHNLSRTESHRRLAAAKVRGGRRFESSRETMLKGGGVATISGDNRRTRVAGSSVAVSPISGDYGV